MSQALVRVAIAGGLGRMGRATQAVLAERSDTILVGRFDRPGAPLADGLVCEADAIAASDVVVDFTTPGGSVALARRCAEAGRPALVIGSTGFSEADEAAFRSLSTRLTIVKAGNFSLGVNMLLGLVRQAAALLPSSVYDIEIVEAHHRRKVDAPSGTALMLGEAAADGRGVDLSAVAVRGRDGEVGPRSAGAIGFAVVRGGGIVGEHAVSFAAEDEILTLSHSARDRSLFARGAVEAAVWAATRPPGLYDMQDVLGFSRPVR